MEERTIAKSPPATGVNHGLVLLALVGAAVVTYLPFAGLAPMQDDYGHVWLAEKYISPSGWGELMRDPLFRCRTTSLAVSAATLQLFGFSIIALHLTGLLLHAFNACLVYALGFCRWIGWRVSALAALVFAVRERHHEAVIWYASMHELLVFAFVLAAALAWIAWLQGGSRWWLSAVGACWVLALASKESGMLLTFLLPALALLYPGRRRAAACVFSLGLALTAVYFLWAFGQQEEHQHFHDGTFSFGAKVLRTAVNSAVRGLWIWGGISLVVLWVNRSLVQWRTVSLAAAWFFAAMLPYVFLTYMPRIPSRHHYLASGGAALLIGFAFAVLIERARRPKAAASIMLLAFVAHNWIYLWTYKRPQFEVRAEVLERLVRLVRDRPGQVVKLRCPNVVVWETQLAAHYRLGIDPGTVISAGQDDGAGPVYSCEALH